MPSVPKKDLLEKFHKKGFWVFSPRYRGSWESHGLFLRKSPAEDIKDVMDEIEKNEITELFDYKKFNIKNPKFYIYGGSFGGPAAILNSSDKRVKRVISVSPVVDFTVESPGEPLDKLKRFVKEGFGRAYNFYDKDWKKLQKGRFYNPMYYLNNKKDMINGRKIWILHARDDDIVLYKSVAEFAKKAGCKLTSFKKGGHGLNKILTNKRRHFRKILKFFE